MMTLQSEDKDNVLTDVLIQSEDKDSVLIDVLIQLVADDATHFFRRWACHRKPFVRLNPQCFVSTHAFPLD